MGQQHGKVNMDRDDMKDVKPGEQGRENLWEANAAVTLKVVLFLYIFFVKAQCTLNIANYPKIYNMV